MYIDTSQELARGMAEADLPSYNTVAQVLYAIQQEQVTAYNAKLL